MTRQLGSLLLAMVVPASGPSTWQRFGLLPPLRATSRQVCTLPSLATPGSAPSPDPLLKYEVERTQPDAEAAADRPSVSDAPARSLCTAASSTAAMPHTRTAAPPDAQLPTVRFQAPRIWLPALTGSGSCNNLPGEPGALASPAGSPERSPANRTPTSTARLAGSHSSHALTLPRNPSSASPCSLRPCSPSTSALVPPSSVSPSSLAPSSTAPASPQRAAVTSRGARSPVTRSHPLNTLSTATITTNTTVTPPSPGGRSSPSPATARALTTTPSATPVNGAAAAAAAAMSSSSPGGGRTATASGASVDPREAAKFAALADSWWRTTDGPFAPLHALNPARVKFIRQSLGAAMGLDTDAPEPLAGLRVLDVGCGGGILSEALARLGAQVLGIDVTRENVEVARLHAREDPRVAARVRYEVISAEDLAASRTETYDVVVASEVLEHVNRPHQLLPVLASLLAPPPPATATSSTTTTMTTGTDGTHSDRLEAAAADHSTAERPAVASALIVSTLNRTPAAWAVAVAGAEYVARVVPPGTHQWRKFITPEELAVMAGACGLQVWHAAGMAPTGPRLSWQLTRDLSINYIATLMRRHEPPQQQQQQQLEEKQQQQQQQQ